MRKGNLTTRKGHTLKIIGGMALPGSVNISSKNFSSVASRQPDGSIKTTITPASPAEQWLRDAKYLPKVMKMILFIITKLKPRDRFIVFGLVLILPILISAIAGPENVEAFAGSKYELWFIWTLRVLTIGFIVYLLMSVRGYHAAEHMAIAAYERHGVDGLDRVAFTISVAVGCFFP